MNPTVVFYCGDGLDYVIFEPIAAHLPAIPVVAKNRDVQRELKRQGVDATLWPAYPRAVIMARHALHRFPRDSIVKIGMRHGAYHFKQFIKPKRYNAFDLYLVTSEKEVQDAVDMGIHTTKAGGFPKLDPMFSPSTEGLVEDVRLSLGLDEAKPTVLFTATWDRSGMSAIDRWFRRLHELTTSYNILVTIHSLTARHYVDVIRATGEVRFIEDKRIWPYLILSDVLVGDTSSIVAEFCALDKPIITFRVGTGSRLTNEILLMLDEVSLRIDHFEQLPGVLESALQNPSALSTARQKWNRIMFDNIDGRHGQRAAKEILATLRNAGIELG